jgi:hypothetical protein
MDFVLRDKMDKLLMSNIVFPWHFQNALKKEGKKKFLTMRLFSLSKEIKIRTGHECGKGVALNSQQ